MSQLNDDQTLHLLHLVGSGQANSLDPLASRMAAADGATWIGLVLERLGRGEGVAPSSLLDGTADLEGLRRLMARGAEEASRGGVEGEASPPADAALAGRLVHDMAVAAGLLHHRVLLSSRPREEWDERLVALSAAAPRPWSSLLRKAADIETDPDEDADDV